MRIVDTVQAIEGRNSVVEYIAQRFGAKAVRDFRTSYKEVRKQMRQFPNSGTIDWNLSTEKTLYRFFYINDLSKMIYCMKGDVIYVVDFWDVRREPPSEIHF